MDVHRFGSYPYTQLNEQERGDRGKCIEKMEIDQYIGNMDTR